MIESPLRDKQQDYPAFYCDVCGGEIYKYDSCVYHDGDVVCLDCSKDLGYDEADWSAIELQNYLQER